jgi:hypothetical protein
MQASTIAYLENAQHDLVSSRVNLEVMGCLDRNLKDEIQACYLESAEKMMRSLRVAIETFDKVTESLRSLDAQASVALKQSTDIYSGTLVAWIRDVKRMFGAEAAHKKYVLGLLGSGLDNEGVEMQVKLWTQEPMINHDLIDYINTTLR